MDKKDVLELKRRMKKDACTFTRISGCYVDGDKNKVAKFNDTFLNLDDEVFYKYLEMAKKVFSGKMQNNILVLPFKNEYDDEKQVLLGLRDSRLKNDELLDIFYDRVIDSYDTADHYLIVVFHDAYDVMTKTSDNNKLDESEEVYDYLLCAVCPVALSKPGLGYLESENNIGARIRDWVVGVPETGFVFPAFSDRSTDMDNVMFYTKNAKAPHMEFAEECLGVESKMTSAEKKEAFTDLIVDTLGDENKDVYFDIQEKINSITENNDVEPDSLSKELTKEAVVNILSDCGLDSESVSAISKQYENVFNEDLPSSEQLLDSKAVIIAEIRNSAMEKAVAKICGSNETDVNVVVNKGVRDAVKQDIIDGQKYLLIPITDETHINITEK